MKIAPFVPLIAAGLLASCATAPDAGRTTIAAAPLLGADGAPKGTATLVSVGERIDLLIESSNLPSGVHGVHLHAVGRCDTPDFASAGPHLNPHGRMHGSQNPQGAHLGDLPNLMTDSAGKGALSSLLAGSPDGIEPLLFDVDGTAIVIHVGPDDYRTDPSGNSGGRIACGVFAPIS